MIPTRNPSLVYSLVESWPVVFTVPTDLEEVPSCESATWFEHITELTFFRGCVVFGRVAGDSASSYLFNQLSNERAANRVNTVANHLLETRIRVDPASKNVNLEFSWADSGSGSGGAPAQSSSSGSGSKGVPADSAPAKEGDRTAAQLEEERLPKPEEKKKEGGAKGEYTMEEVGKHNKEEDCWVVIDGEVLDVTK